MQHLKMYRVFEVMFCDSEKKEEQRVVIRDLRRKQQIAIPFDNNYANAENIARKYLEDRGIPIVGVGMVYNGGVLLSDNFSIELI